MADLTRGSYFLLSKPFDQQRTATPVTVLHRIPYEPDLYRVKLPCGRVTVACRSLLVRPNAGGTCPAR